MIDRNMSDAEYIAQMKAAWGTQLDQYILTIRSIENKFERLCAQLDKLEEQQKAHDTLKSEHRRLLEDRQFWFGECGREIRHAPPRDGSLSIKEIIEGHAESIRQSVEGFPPWVQELKVKEQLGFFEPILEGPEDCPKTS